VRHHQATTRTSARRGYPIKYEWRGWAAPLRMCESRLMERMGDANGAATFSLRWRWLCRRTSFESVRRGQPCQSASACR